MVAGNGAPFLNASTDSLAKRVHEMNLNRALPRSCTWVSNILPIVPRTEMMKLIDTGIRSVLKPLLGLSSELRLHLLEKWGMGWHTCQIFILRVVQV